MKMEVKRGDWKLENVSGEAGQRRTCSRRKKNNNRLREDGGKTTGAETEESESRRNRATWKNGRGKERNGNRQLLVGCKKDERGNWTASVKEKTHMVEGWKEEEEWEESVSSGGKKMRVESVSQRYRTT